jgi:hypothetical protein
MLFFKYFFGVPRLATFIFVFSTVKASMAYNHPEYGARIQTHNHSVVSLLP